MTHEDQVKTLLGLLATADPDDTEQFGKNGKPNANWLSGEVGFSVSAELRDTVWEMFNAPPDEELEPSQVIEEDSVEKDGVTYNKEDFERTKSYRAPGGVVIARWVDRHGGKWYADCEATRALKLPVYPFSASNG